MTPKIQLFFIRLGMASPVMWTMIYALEHSRHPRLVGCSCYEEWVVCGVFAWVALALVAAIFSVTVVWGVYAAAVKAAE